MCFRSWLSYLCLSAAICGLITGADWPQFLGPNRNCTSSETGLLLSWPKDGLPKLWEKKIGEGFSGPVIAGERLILFQRVGDKETVECLDAATGKDRWKYDYPTNYRDALGKGNGPRSTPLIAKDRVYTLGAEGRLHCLELETGKKVWDRNLANDYAMRESYFGVGSTPILDSDRLILNLGAKGAGIVAFDPATGKEVWKATDDAASYSSPVAVTIDGVRYVIFLTRAGIVFADPQTGVVRFSKPWRARIDASVNAATPVVVGDEAFFSAEYATGAILLKVSKEKTQEVWKKDRILSSHYNTPIHHAGHLYGIDGRQEGGAAQLRCVELQTGKILWAKERFGCASLILVDGHLIALCEDGDLALIEATPQAFREKGRFSALKAPPCRAEIALANGRLYARDSDRLVCWNLKK